MTGIREVRMLAAPEDGGRVETGPTQFGEDWPGVFIRGDNAFAYAMALEMIFGEHGKVPEEHKEISDQVNYSMVRGLITVLRSCIVSPANTGG